MTLIQHTEPREKSVYFGGNTLRSPVGLVLTKQSKPPSLQRIFCHHPNSGWHVTSRNQGLSLQRETLGTRLQISRHLNNKNQIGSWKGDVRVNFMCTFYWQKGKGFKSWRVYSPKMKADKFTAGIDWCITIKK